MQAIALGGGSLVNSAICVRPPAFVFDELVRRASTLAHTSARRPRSALRRGRQASSASRRRPTTCRAARNLLFREGCDALGIESEPIARNVRGCRGSGECFTGCRARAKQSMDISYVPAAIRAGARVLHLRARRAGAARAVAASRACAGRVVAPFTGRPEPRASRVDAQGRRARGRLHGDAACCCSRAAISRTARVRSAATSSSIPGVAVMGVFPEPRAIRSSARRRATSRSTSCAEGFKLETLWAPPAVLAVRMPGAGLALKQRLAEIPYAVDRGTRSRAATARSARCAPKRRGSLEPALTWRLHPDDVPVLGRALGVLVEIFFAAGATQGPARRARHPGRAALAGDEARVLRDAELPRRPTS